MDWQLLVDCLFARFSDPSGPQIPVVRRAGVEDLSSTTSRRFRGFTEPGWLGDPGVCRCIETLHL